MAVVRSPDFLRALIRETALATLIHQRRLTPSCGGHAPTAERTVGPARMIAESLTPKPGIREQICQQPTSQLAIEHMAWAEWTAPAAQRRLLSLGKRGPEHRQTASRLRFGRFILQNIPVFREHAVGHSDDIGGDPTSGPSSSRKPTMDDHVIVFSNDQARFVLQRRWRAPDQIEQAVAPRRDVRAVLNVVR